MCLNFSVVISPVLALINKSTGAVTQRALRIGDDGTADFADFNATDDIPVVTTEFRRLGAYQVPDGFVLRIQPGKRVHAFFGDDT